MCPIRFWDKGNVSNQILGEGKCVQSDYRIDQLMTGPFSSTSTVEAKCLGYEVVNGEVHSYYLVYL